MNAEVKATVKTILELLDDDQQVILLNAKDENPSNTSIVSCPDSLLWSLRQDILEADVINLVSVCLNNNAPIKIYYKECET